MARAHTLASDIDPNDAEPVLKAGATRVVVPKFKSQDLRLP